MTNEFRSLVLVVIIKFVSGNLREYNYSGVFEPGKMAGFRVSESSNVFLCFLVCGRRGKRESFITCVPAGGWITFFFLTANRSESHFFFMEVEAVGHSYYLKGSFGSLVHQKQISGIPVLCFSFYRSCAAVWKSLRPQS